LLAGCAPDNRAEGQYLDRATLISLAGEKSVTLPHILAAEDFAPSGGRVRFRLEVPLANQPSAPLGIFVSKLSLAGRLRLNGVDVGACGLAPLENLRCLHQPQLFTPPASLWHPGINILEFEIFANDRQMNGLSPVRVGSADALYEGPYLRKWLWQVELLQGMSWLAACLGGLALVVAWLLRPEKLYLWFGLCSIANALSNLNVLVTTPLVGFELFSWFVFSIRMITTPLGLGMLLTYFERSTPAIERLLMACVVVMPVLTWLSGSNRWVVTALYVPMLIAMLALTVAMVRWTWRSRRPAHIAVTGLTLGLMAISILDWLRLSGRSVFEGVYGITYTFTGFMLVFGFLLMARLVSSLLAERKLSAMLGLASRAARAGFWDWDLASGRVSWSRDMESLFGFSPNRDEDFDNWAAWRAAVHPDDLSMAEEVSLAAAREQRPLALDYRIVRPDGELRWIETRADIHRDETGKPRSLAGISLDVTERRLAELELATYRDQLEGMVAERTAELQAATRRLADKERNIRQILENLPIPITVASLADGAPFTFINATFSATYGYAGETLPSLRHWIDTALPDAEDRARLLAGVEAARQDIGVGADADHRRMAPMKCRILRQDHAERHALVNALAGDGIIILSWIDITPLKQAEQALIEAKHRAEHLERTKSAFLANMSHEIRTPMNGILGMTQLALRDQPDDRQRHYLQSIEFSAQSLLGILNDILDISKIEAGKLHIEQAPFELGRLVENVLLLVEPAAEQKHLMLRFEFDPDLQPYYQGDALRIRQVLANLLGNAVKFTAAGEVKLAVSRPALGRLRFAVSDTGIGLSAEQQKQLFLPFSQADVSTTREYGGTGLGLAISKQLVELMGGQIGVDSAPGQGSCFHFEIAAEACDAPVAPKPGITTEVSQEPAASLMGRRVLLVEDNAINREIARRILEMEGLRVELAEDGQQAVDQFRASRPDLILMDVQMPVMDGYEATRRIRELDPDVPIIALTANAFPEDIDKTRAAGMNLHLTKPIEVDEMRATLRRFLAPGPVLAASESEPMGGAASRRV
jgi:PAS domain S-box-containing protein